MAPSRTPCPTRPDPSSLSPALESALGDKKRAWWALLCVCHSDERISNDVKAKEFDRWSYLFLPCNLFGVCICGRYKYSIYSLIKFIENLRDSKGRYFSSHYMHSDIKFRNPISVDVNIIMELYAYTDLLKSTQMILCEEDANNSKVEYESATLDTKCSHASLILIWTFINV